MERPCPASPCSTGHPPALPPPPYSSEDMAQNDTVARRLENEAFLSVERNKALAAKTASQPHNTARSYASKQAQWQVSIVFYFSHFPFIQSIYYILTYLQKFCAARSFEDAALVTQDKLVAWLSTDVLLCRVPRRSRKGKGGAKAKARGGGAEAEAEQEGEVLPEDRGGGDGDEDEAGAVGSLYTSSTVDAYVAAV